MNRPMEKNREPSTLFSSDRNTVPPKEMAEPARTASRRSLIFLIKTPSFRVMKDGTVRQVYFYCVDVSEFAVNKLADRGSLSARGIVTNVQDFVVLLQKALED